MRVDVGEPLVDGGDAVRVVGVLGLAQQAGALCVGTEHPVDEAVLAARRLLRDVPDAGRARHGDGAEVGREIAGNDLQ